LHAAGLCAPVQQKANAPQAKLNDGPIARANAVAILRLQTQKPDR
jgi:hypothetical protein